MSTQRPRRFSRRRFLRGLTLAGTAGLLGGHARPLAAEPPPEITRVRLPRYPVDVACIAPQWIAEDLLRAEGFSSVEYLETPDQALAVAAGELDLSVFD